MKFCENDEIRTADDSTVEMLLDEGGSTGHFELRPKSRLRMKQISQTGAGEEKTTILDLAIGQVLVHTEKLRGDSKFEVRILNSDDPNPLFPKANFGRVAKIGCKSLSCPKERW